jgi:hypothetical protein
VRAKLLVLNVIHLEDPRNVFKNLIGNVELSLKRLVSFSQIFELLDQTSVLSDEVVLGTGMLLGWNIDLLLLRFGRKDLLVNRLQLDLAVIGLVRLHSLVLVVEHRVVLLLEN